MKQAGDRNRVCTCGDHGCDVVDRASSTRRDYGYGHIGSNGFVQVDVKALSGAFSVNRSEKNFTSAAINGFAYPFERVAARLFAAVVSIRLPAAAFALRLHR